MLGVFLHTVAVLGKVSRLYRLRRSHVSLGAHVWTLEPTFSRAVCLLDAMDPPQAPERSLSVTESDEPCAEAEVSARPETCGSCGRQLPRDVLACVECLGRAKVRGRLQHLLRGDSVQISGEALAIEVEHLITGVQWL